MEYSLYEHSACGVGSKAKEMYASCDDAFEKSKVHQPCLDARQISVNGIDIDFALNWRPTSLFPITYDEDRFSTCAITDSVIATYPSSTGIIPFIFRALESYSIPSSSETRGDVPVLVNDHIPITYLDKKEPTDHLPIFPGFRSSHICWLNADDEWMILQRRYDGKVTASTTDPRCLGVIDSDCSRLVLSLMSGAAFFTLEKDDPGTIHIWEFL